jgi:hypothetical protein
MCRFFHAGARPTGSVKRHTALTVAPYPAPVAVGGAGGGIARRCVVCGSQTRRSSSGSYRKTCTDACLTELKRRQGRRSRRTSASARPAARPTVVRDQPSSPPPRGASRWVDGISRTISLAAVVLIPVAVLTLLGFCGYALVTQPPEPVTTVSQDTARYLARLDAYSLVTWTYVEAACSDGWRSPSIGRRGACSHHGGVVTVWAGSDGSRLRCRDGGPPSRKAEQLRQLDAVGRLYC